MASFNILLSSMLITEVEHFVLLVTLDAKSLTLFNVLLNLFAIVIELALLSASSTIIEVAAPPAPRISISFPYTLTFISCRESTKPAPSVV